jgi:hypothetical protein
LTTVPADVPHCQDRREVWEAELESGDRIDDPGIFAGY